MSSISSLMCPPQITPRGCELGTIKLSGTGVPLLHQIEHSGKSRLEFQCLFDLICGDIGIFPVFQRAQALMFTHEPNKCWSICLPVLRKAFEVLKDTI